MEGCGKRWGVRGGRGLMHLMIESESGRRK